jgi:diamine N-acetyltransferase
VKLNGYAAIWGDGYVSDCLTGGAERCGDGMKIGRTTDYGLVARLNKPVHELHATLYPDYFKDYDFLVLRESFKQLMSNEAYIFLVLEDNAEPIGFAWIEIKNYPETPFKKPYRSVYVHQISIEPQRERLGYGSKLMEHIFGIARNQEIDLVELDYWFENENAKRFYKKHGFVTYREFVYKAL